MNRRFVFRTIGLILMVEAGLMALSIIVGLIYHDQYTISLVIAAAITFCVGFLLHLIKASDTAVYARDGFAIVALSWVIMSIFGGLPFIISGTIPSFVDAFFETVSGFTTTGATILNEVEPLGYALLFWRSFTHWIGGMGVLVFVLVIVPLGGQRSIHIVRAEVPGPTSDKLVPRMSSTARILYAIYSVMTILEVIILFAGGMPLYDCFINAFGTAGTGGFSCHTESIAVYNSAYADTVIGVFMLLFGINFNLYYLLLIKNFKSVFKNEELRCYLGVIAFAVITIAINISSAYGGFFEALRYSFFQVSSIITTTGFSTANFDLWPQYSRAMLVLLMFIGACASSTGGGIKVSRVLLLAKSAGRGIRRLFRPRSIETVHMDGKPISEEVINNSAIYFVCYAMIAAASFIILSIDNFSFETNFSAMAACFNNVGPGLDVVGPVSSYQTYSNLSKLVLSFDMLTGRLEIIPILILFMPTLWKKSDREPVAAHHHKIAARSLGYIKR